MAQTDIPTCSSPKAKEIYTGEVNDGGQTESNASAESWLIQVKRMFEPQYKMWQLSENVSIYRVPKGIFINKKEAYIPFVASFGPYHHKTNNILSAMDQRKVEAVHRMLGRLNINVTSLTGEIRKLDSKIRECYDEEIEWDDETLSWMLAMDACFILEFFRSQIDSTESFSLLFKDHQNAVYWYILMDIMKLENQIPLIILTTLLRIEFGTDEGAITRLTQLLNSSILFNGYPFYVGVSSELKEHILKDRCHLLDLYRMVIKHLLIHPSPESAIAVKPDGSGGANNITSDDRRCGWPVNVELTGCVRQLSCADILRRHWSKRSGKDSMFNPSAELLVKAGIEFQPGRIGFENRMFGKGKFSLPQIHVHDVTETLLRNLMAYEECQRCSLSPKQAVISRYVSLLDNLIDSAKDVSILRKSQVVMGDVGSDENIALIFNHITKDITESRIEEFDAVMDQAKEHYNNQWKVWVNQFKEEHFSKPWSILSFVAAILALGMTFVQTLYSIKK